MNLPSILLLSISTLLLSSVASANDKIPAGIQQVAMILPGMMENEMGSLRISIALLSGDVFDDPPPRADSFDSQASYLMTLDTRRHLGVIKLLLGSMLRSDWPKSASGYPRLKFSIIGPWQRNYLGFLIDRKNSLIQYNDVWYKPTDDSIFRYIDELKLNACNDFLK